MAAEPHESVDVVYTNRYKLDLTLGRALGQLRHDIHRHRSLIWQYFRRDFVASYRGTLLGVAWKIILPLVPLSIYVFLYLVGVFRREVGMNAALYVVAGMTFWSLWAEVLSVTLNRLTSQANMVKKMKVPMMVVYLTGLGQVLFDTLVRFALLTVILILCAEQLSPWCLLMPIMALPFLFFAFGLGILLSFFAVFTRDVTNVVGIIVRYGVFVSAVIFPLPMDGRIGRIIMWNPMFHLVENTRSVIVTGSLTTPRAYAVCSVVALLLCAFAVKKACSMEERLVWAL